MQCSDARDLDGHYPPICYPNAGFTLAVVQPPKEDTEFAAPGTLYKFTQDTLNGTRAMWVFNLMVLPDGQTAPNIWGVDHIARSRRMRCFGAAEIQVITDVGMAEAERTQVVNLLLDKAKPLMDAIRSGVVQ